MILPFLVVIAIAGFVLRAQPGAPPLARKMPFAFVVLESWCFFAWIYGDRLRIDNVDAVLANVSNMQEDYHRGLLISDVATVIMLFVAAMAIGILIHGALAVCAEKKRRA